MTADKKDIFLYYWHILTSPLPSISVVIPIPEYRFGAFACGGPGDGLKARLKEAGLHDWRFDWAFPSYQIFCEVEGGVFSGGRHTRGAGYSSDLDKYNTAASMGWLGFRFTPDMLTDNPQRCIQQVINGISSRLGATVLLSGANANKELPYASTQ